jgi:hypothetical protein
MNIRELNAYAGLVEQHLEQLFPIQVDSRVEREREMRWLDTLRDSQKYQHL